MRWACLLFFFLISFCSGGQDPGRVIYHDAVIRNAEREALSSKNLPPPPPRDPPLRLEDLAGQTEFFQSREPPSLRESISNKYRTGISLSDNREASPALGTT
jgi:hypothetical protein